MSTRDLNISKDLSNKIESGKANIGGLQLEFDMKEDWWIPKEYITKDSGERQQFSTGMVRDTQTNKPRYDLVWRPGLKRLAELYQRGSVKYSDRNWQKAGTQEELDRFVSSANRHFEQWLQGDRSEDHMAGTIFNLFGAEYVFSKMQKEGKNPSWTYGE